MIAKNDQEFILKSNIENYIFGKVLDNIAREEGEDRPNISQLLAWAKGGVIMCCAGWTLI